MASKDVIINGFRVESETKATLKAEAERQDRTLQNLLQIILRNEAERIRKSRKQ